MDIKPCPFCGGKAVLQRLGGYYEYVRCVNEKCTIKPITPCYLEEGRAIKEWNKREDGKDGEQDAVL